MPSTIKASFEWTGDLLSTFGLEPGGRVQAAIDNAVIRYCMPYCPWGAGVLAKSPYTASSPGKVVYDTPYARYLYYNLVMGPNIPFFDDNSDTPVQFRSPKGVKKSIKKPEQAFEFKTDTNPMAGAFWFERMKADHSQDIAEEAKAVARDK